MQRRSSLQHPHLQHPHHQHSHHNGCLWMLVALLIAGYIVLLLVWSATVASPRLHAIACKQPQGMPSIARTERATTPTEQPVTTLSTPTTTTTTAVTTTPTLTTTTDNTAPLAFDQKVLILVTTVQRNEQRVRLQRELWLDKYSSMVVYLSDYDSPAFHPSRLVLTPEHCLADHFVMPKSNSTATTTTTTTEPSTKTTSKVAWQRLKCCRYLYFYEHIWPTQFPHVEWVLKVDDDTLVHVPNLLRMAQSYAHHQDALVFGQTFYHDVKGGFRADPAPSNIPLLYPPFPGGGGGWLMNAAARSTLLKTPRYEGDSVRHT
jgi:hypothetical protein